MQDQLKVLVLKLKTSGNVCSMMPLLIDFMTSFYKQNSNQIQNYCNNSPTLQQDMQGGMQRILEHQQELQNRKCIFNTLFGIAALAIVVAMLSAMLDGPQILIWVSMVVFGIVFVSMFIITLVRQCCRTPREIQNELLFNAHYPPNTSSIAQDPHYQDRGNHNRGNQNPYNYQNRAIGTYDNHPRSVFDD